MVCGVWLCASTIFHQPVIFQNIFTELFSSITELDEYYLTASEMNILEKYAEEIVSLLREHNKCKKSETFNIVELGAGDGRKTKVLLRAMLKADVPFEYMPVDISHGAMIELLSTFKKDLGGNRLHIHGIVGDYMESVAYISKTWPNRRTVVLFLGSSIGNFGKQEAERFLTKLRHNMKTSDMLFIGFDLKKDAEVLRRAYSDSQGVSANFNCNLLKRMNRELGATFDLHSFCHLAVYNPVRGAIEMYLISEKEQIVRLANDDLHFDEHEAILTELSHKYLPKDALAVACNAGFKKVATYFDDRGWFMDALMEIA